MSSKAIQGKALDTNSERRRFSNRWMKHRNARCLSSSRGAHIQTSSSHLLKEHIASVGSRSLVSSSFPGLEFHAFASADCGATAFGTGLAIFQPGGRLPYHTHEFSEAMTVVEGTGRLLVAGRAYTLTPLDSAHIPAGVPHEVQNADPANKLRVHTAFASPRPTREMVDGEFPLEERGLGVPAEGDPEGIVRFDRAEVYELSPNAFFTDLFARRLGAVGICGGYGRFLPGASLPCHIHDYDESITIVTGSASCLVQGRRHELSGCATAYIPKGLPHRFVNTSSEEMAMIWVYAGDEPDRRIVDNGYCSGARPWPGADLIDPNEIPNKAG